MKEKSRVLVAVENPAERNSLKNQLADWGYDAIEAASQAPSLEPIMPVLSPGVLLMDKALFDKGSNPSEGAKTSDGELAPFTIILASKADMDTADRWGAQCDDYILRPFQLFELKFRLGAAMKVRKLQEELAAARKRLAAEAVTDSLTGVLNRKALIKEIRLGMERARREQKLLSIAIFEIDDFESIAGKSGHMATEGALRGAAMFLSRSLRAYDVIGRLGAKEFLLILPDCSLEAARKIISRIRLMISNEIIATPGGALKLTMSCGAGQLTAGVESAEDFIKSAEEDLNRAKK